MRFHLQYSYRLVDSFSFLENNKKQGKKKEEQGKMHKADVTALRHQVCAALL